MKAWLHGVLGEVKRAVFEQQFLSCVNMVLIALLERGGVGGDT